MGLEKCLSLTGLFQTSLLLSKYVKNVFIAGIVVTTSRYSRGIISIKLEKCFLFLFHLFLFFFFLSATVAFIRVNMEGCLWAHFV